MRKQAAEQSNDTYCHASTLPDESAATEWAAVQPSDTCSLAGELPDESAIGKWNGPRSSPTTLTAMQAHCLTSQLQPSGLRSSQAMLNTQTSSLTDESAATK